MSSPAAPREPLVGAFPSPTSLTWSVESWVSNWTWSGSSSTVLAFNLVEHLGGLASSLAYKFLIEHLAPLRLLTGSQDLSLTP